MVTEDIRRASTKMQAAADGVGRADPSGDVEGVNAALPSSQSASAAQTLSGTWRRRFQGWKEDASSLSRRLERGAENYDRSDHNAAVRSMRGTYPR